MWILNNKRWIIVVLFSFLSVSWLSSPVNAQCCRAGVDADCGGGGLSLTCQAPVPPEPNCGPPGSIATYYCRGATGADPNFRLPRYNDIGANFKFVQFNYAIKSDIGRVVTAAIPYIYVVAGLLLFAYLLYGAFHLVTSFGSPKAILEAWLIIFRAVVGFILIFASFWLIQLVEKVFGLKII